VNMVNWNWMLPGMLFERENVDGLKTGTTDLAGATFAGTAKEDGRRLITVVLNSGDDKSTHFVETDKMMDFGFDEWTMQEVIENWKEVYDYEPLSVEHGKEDIINIEHSVIIEMILKLDNNV